MNTRQSWRNRSNSAWQKWKKLRLGRQSSSRIMPSSTWEKNQSMALDGPNWQPSFTSRNRVWSSQSQSTAETMRRTSAQAAASPGRPGLGPSTATKSRLGLARRMRSKTSDVTCGRLKAISSTGVVTSGRTKVGWLIAPRAYHTPRKKQAALLPGAGQAH